MTTKTDKKWVFPESRIRSVVRSVEAVFRHRDMSKLTKLAYEFIILKHGFIAHYNIDGFRGVYENGIDAFATALIWGEGGIRRYNHRGNFEEADRQKSDPQFHRWYGAEYCKGSGRIMREICRIAEGFLNPLGIGKDR